MMKLVSKSKDLDHVGLRNLPSAWFCAIINNIGIGGSFMGNSKKNVVLSMNSSF